MAGTLQDFKEQQEEKDKVAAEVQPTETPSAEGEKAVKQVEDDVVIIGGQKRPLKNYESELRRKHEEEIERIKSEYGRNVQQPQQQPQQPTQQDFMNQVYQMADNEILTTGKTVPIQTIMQVANQISQHNLQSNLKTKDYAEKNLRSFRRQMRKEPDWNELEDDFEALVDEMPPEMINPKTLEVAFLSIRGRKIPDKIKSVKEQVKKEVESDTVILNQPVTNKTVTSKPKTSLTPSQRLELERMNMDNDMEWTEEEYLDSLKRKQDRFKAQGFNNIPQHLADVPI